MHIATDIHTLHTPTVSAYSTKHLRASFIITKWQYLIKTFFTSCELFAEILWIKNLNITMNKHFLDE